MNIDQFIDRWKVLHDRRKRAHHRGRAWGMIALDASALDWNTAEAFRRAERWGIVETKLENRIHQLIQEYQKHAPDVTN